MLIGPYIQIIILSSDIPFHKSAHDVYMGGIRLRTEKPDYLTAKINILFRSHIGCPSNSLIQRTFLKGT